MWNIGNRPAYSPINTKLGELIVASTPRPAPKPFASTVLPAPSSPHRQTTSPGSATVARREANVRVASGLGLSSSIDGSAAVVTRPSGKAFEIADRDGDRRPSAEANERRLERDAGWEATGTGEARPRPLGAGQRP